MRNRMYGGVRGRKTKVGGNYFVFLLLDFILNTQAAVLFKSLYFSPLVSMMS